ncbi:hypothetical protein HM1_1193 [Heliomicrobium modesticaldum Ice1]|uniref:Uncharacterized protein n=1 Tax=Heliobacterium modesticaldum (strain ATCC 51547 / Ice1) TaxID=498761 RepID=B0THE3_HELMI|nr:hypothetical protein HM1_1193 [Heliomicrobium modesticaldum Ice1]
MKGIDWVEKGYHRVGRQRQFGVKIAIIDNACAKMSTTAPSCR